MLINLFAARKLARYMKLDNDVLNIICRNYAMDSMRRTSNRLLLGSSNCKLIYSPIFLECSSLYLYFNLMEPVGLFSCWHAWILHFDWKRTNVIFRFKIFCNCHKTSKSLNSMFSFEPTLQLPSSRILIIREGLINTRLFLFCVASYVKTVKNICDFRCVLNSLSTSSWRRSLFLRLGQLD